MKQTNHQKLIFTAAAFKRSMLACLIIMFMFLNIGITYAQTFVEQHGQLRVQGNKIVDKNGDPVQLRGMALYWSQWVPKYYNYNTLKWLRDDWCVNTVRASIAIGSGGYATNPTTEMNKVITVVDAAIALGIYVIVDFHDSNAQDKLPIAKQFFSDISKRYGNSPNILYETYNEPLNVSWSTVIKPYHEAVITTIRQNDPDNIIICGTRNWSQRVDEASLNPINRPNIAYTLHYYAASHKQSLRDIAQSALNNGIAIFVTEYGTTEASGDGFVDAAESRRWWDFLNRNYIGHCNWSISDIKESSSALMPGASVNGGWTLSQIKPSGQLVRDELKARCSNNNVPSCTPTAIAPYIQINGGAWTALSSASVLAGDTVMFGPQPTTGGSWSWTGPNSFSATTREVTLNGIQTNQAGTYTATYINAGGCKSTSAFTISVTGPCTPSTIVPYVQVNAGTWTAASTATLLAGGSLVLGPQPVTGSGWSWSGPNGFSATTREVTFTGIQTAQAGSYVATYTNAGGCKSSATFTVNVSNPCTPTAIVPYVQINGGAWTAASYATLSAGGSVMFGPQPVTGGSWSWSGPNGFSAITREVSLANIQTTQAGSYVATYSNAGGCKSAATFTVTVSASNQPPVVSIASPLNNASFTEPANLTVTATSTDADGSISSVAFYNNAVLIDADSTSPYSASLHNLPAGTYKLTAIATDDQGASSTSAAVTIVVNPVVVSTDPVLGPDCGGVNTTISFEVNSSLRTGANSYSWWVNGQTQSIKPVSGANYKVNIVTGAYFTGGQVCVGISYNRSPYYASYCKNITKCSSAASLLAAASVVPNPSADVFTLTVPEGVSSISVVDINGIEMFSHGSLTAGESIEFGSKFSAGLYMLKITYANGSSENKRIMRY